MLRVQGRSAWIRSLGRNHRGLFRVDGSANFTESVFDLPPSLRFFAGGDNNLRGYEYESISPKDSEGKLTGAKYMVTSSLEYQYRVYGTGGWRPSSITVMHGMTPQIGKLALALVSAGRHRWGR